MSLTASPTLWQNLISLRRLDAAWEKVRSNQGAAGGDGVSIAQFQPGAARKLMALAQDLDAGTWAPGPYRRVDIPKRKGGTRRLTIPCVRDRVVHTALSQVLTPVLDPMFEDGSYAYRPGRSVQQAVRAIDRLRQEGYWHVIEADIVGFFDNVRHDLAVAKLEAALTGQSDADRIVDLVTLILEHQAQDSGVMGRGLALGSPLSPLLANLYLTELDAQIHGRGIRIIRFADDFVVLCKKRASAEAALEDLRAVLDEHGLDLHEDGTRVRDFDRGFAFLGSLFVRSMVLQQVNDPEEDMVTLLREVGDQDAQEGATQEAEARAGYDRGTRVLYLTEPGRRIALRNLSFEVQNEDGRAFAGIAHGRVDRIELGPGTRADWTVIEHALATQTDLAVVNARGETLGLLAAPQVDHGARHLAQARMVLDPDAARAIAARLVEARIRNMRTQLFRSNRKPQDSEVVAALARMQRTLRKLPQAESVAALRGLEGAAAAEFWPMLARLTEGAPDPFTRDRPARDGLNAALNYLSALLTRDMRAAVLRAGLHPGFGVLHASRDRADPCVWDLVEPFRTPLTEGLASYLFNARRLRPKMFQPGRPSVRITPEGRRALIRGYEAAMARRVNAPGRTTRLAWRPMMLRQAQDLVRAAQAQDPALFHPYLMEP